MPYIPGVISEEAKYSNQLNIWTLVIYGSILDNLVVHSLWIRIYSFFNTEAQYITNASCNIVWIFWFLGEMNISCVPIIFKMIILNFFLSLMTVCKQFPYKLITSSFCALSVHRHSKMLSYMTMYFDGINVRWLKKPRNYHEAGV